MFVSLKMLAHLLSISFLYMIILFSGWEFMGVWSCLFAVIPLLSFSYVFGNVLLVYVSILICTFLCLIIMGVPLNTIYYNNIFFCIQALLLSLSMATVIFKYYKTPTIKKEKSLKNINLEDMVLYIDPVSHIITKASSKICKVYGWRRRELVGKSLRSIYLEDIFDNPPLDFWESLNTKNMWCGAVDVIFKNGTVYEEIAYYTAVLDENQKIISIEKKVLELYVKPKTSPQNRWYQQFYEETFEPMAVVDKTHKVKFANPAFIRRYNPIFEETVLTLEGVSTQKIENTIKRCFKGEHISFDEGRDVFSFKPYFCPRRHIITHILLTIRDNPKFIEKEEDLDINLSKLLKQSLTKWYAKNSNTSVKLFTRITFDMLVCSGAWQELTESMFEFTEQHVESKKLVISCNQVDETIYVTISFDGVMYFDKEHTKHLLTPVFRGIKNISSKFGIVKGRDGELLLVIEFQQNLQKTIAKIF